MRYCLAPVSLVIITKICLCVLSRVQLFATPWTVDHQALLPMEFSRQEYWSGVSFPASGDLSNPRIKARSFASPVLASRIFTISATWEIHQKNKR